MKSRDVIGKKIVRVDHTRWFNSHRRAWEKTVDRIVLDDGSMLRPFAFETRDCPAATINLIKMKGGEKNGKEKDSRAKTRSAD